MRLVFNKKDLANDLTMKSFEWFLPPQSRVLGIYFWMKIEKNGKTHEKNEKVSNPFGAKPSRL